MLVLGGALGCGPGLEAMHESTLRFEHCYRLDMDAKIAPPHREHCWRDWTESYASGQPLDRVEYARRRIVKLESGDVGLLRIQGAAPEGRVFEELSLPRTDTPAAAPAPTSAHAPPPKTEPLQSESPPPSDPASKPSSLPTLPGGACTAQCESALGDCNRLCSAKQADCAVCAEDYRRCMRRCFE
jgi:hypothetical protein